MHNLKERLKTRNSLVSPFGLKFYRQAIFFFFFFKSKTQMAKRHLQWLTEQHWTLPGPEIAKCQNSIWWIKLTIRLKKKTSPVFSREHFLSPKMTCNLKQVPIMMQRQVFQKGTIPQTVLKPHRQKWYAKGPPCNYTHHYCDLIKDNQKNIFQNPILTLI